MLAVYVMLLISAITLEMANGVWFEAEATPNRSTALVPKRAAPPYILQLKLCAMLFVSSIAFVFSLHVKHMAN